MHDVIYVSQMCTQEAGGEGHEAPAQEEDVPDDTQDEY